MRKICSLLLISSIALVAKAEEFVAQHQQTSSVPNGRFEIIQSELAVRWTFKLDRFNGRIWQLVLNKDDNNTWGEMLVLGIPKPSSPPHPHFQIFTSSLAVRFTLLIDTDTGKTWQVTTDKGKNKDGTVYEITYWSPFSE